MLCLGDIMSVVLGVFNYSVT